MRWSASRLPWGATLIEARLQTHRELHAPALHAIQQLDSTLTEVVQEAVAFVAWRHPEEKLEFRQLVDRLELEAARFREIARLDDPGEEPEAAQFASIEMAAVEVIRLSEAAFRAVEEGDTTPPGFEDRYEELVDRLNADLESLVETELGEVEAEHAGALNLLAQSEQVFAGIGVLTLALALLFGRVVGTAIGRANAERRRSEEEGRLLDRRVRETQKLETLGVLAGGIAHDFNNLLVGIIGNAEVAISLLEPGSPALEPLDGVREAGEQGADLTSELLAYAGKADVRVEPFELSELVQGTLRLFQRSVSETARWEVDLGADELWVEGDATQIRQVVMNLITNAADALGGEAGTLRVRAGAVGASTSDPDPKRVLPVQGSGEHCFFEVADTGCGMDMDTLERVFDPFFTTKAGGRGLGLAALRGNVRSHGGGVEISSEPGRGSLFRVLLPRIDAPAKTPIGRYATSAPTFRWSSTAGIRRTRRPRSPPASRTPPSSKSPSASSRCGRSFGKQASSPDPS